MTKKVDLQDVYRNARTGRFVTERYADRHPSTTEHERRPLPSPAHKHSRRARESDFENGSADPPALFHFRDSDAEQSAEKVKSLHG